MLFNTPQFFLFLVVTIGLFYASPNPCEVDPAAASYFFYMSWNWRFVRCSFALTVSTMSPRSGWSTRMARKRKLFLVIGLAGQSGFLGFFKYYNFVGDHLAPARAVSSTLSSFFRSESASTRFQSMSYVIDVYRGEQKPSAIRSITRCSSHFFRNWWPALLFARANSSPITIIGLLRRRRGSPWRF